MATLYMPTEERCVTLTCEPCPVCHEQTDLYVSHDEWEHIIEGERIAVIFPDASPEEHEIMISGTHTTCWDLLFSDLDDS